MVRPSALNPDSAQHMLVAPGHKLCKHGRGATVQLAAGARLRTLILRQLQRRAGHDTCHKASTCQQADQKLK